MSNITKRFEKKYFIRESIDRVVHQISIFNSMQIVVEYPSRCVNSLYLDTSNLQCFCNGKHNLLPKKKFRFRWYGEEGEIPVCPSFEIKSNNGIYKTKQSIPLDEFDLENFQDMLNMPSIKSACKDIELLPFLFTKYRRRYYVDTRKKLRLTFDSDIQYSSKRHAPVPSVALRNYNYLMEAKVYDVFSNIAVPIEKKSFSKYIEAGSLLF